jgi:hypothetical protein
MQIYLWLHGCPLQRQLRGSLPRIPSNLRGAESGPYRIDQAPHSSAALLRHTPNLGRPASRLKIASR